MRCPKCGYISFDNVEKCLKCKKNISKTSQEFLGSVLNVATPSFLNLGSDEEDVEIGEAAVGETAESVEEEFDLVDPDLDILVDEDAEADSGEIEMDLGDAAAAAPAAAAMDELADSDELSELDELSGDLSEIEAFTEDDGEAAADDDVALDLGALEEAPEDDIPAMEVPDELADLSDLSPPDKLEMQTEEPAAAEPEAELDLGGLDDVFESDDSPAATEPKKETVLSLDMDEDLNFELDLGGLSIHDDDKK